MGGKRMLVHIPGDYSPGVDCRTQENGGTTMSATEENLVFSSAAFRASKTGKPLIQQLGQKHLDILDGKPVQPGPNGYGIIYYEVDGEEWELYPVMPEWCEERNQTSLFTQDGGTEK